MLHTYSQNSDANFFVSFPRTGVKWISLISQLYFNRPIIPESSYCTNSENVLYAEYHDCDGYIDISDNQNVVYLYKKDICSVIFSYIKFNGQYCKDYTFMKRCTEDLTLHYIEHLKKWLYAGKNPTVVVYENFIKNFNWEYSKICKHFSYSIDFDRLEKCKKRVTIYEVKQKVPTALIETSKKYQNHRRMYIETFKPIIYKVIEEWYPNILEVLNI